MRRFSGLFALLALFAFTGAVGAESLSTIYAGDNSGAPGGAVYFDATVGFGPILVTGFDTNTSSLDPFEMVIYRTAPGVSAFGNETNPDAWVVVAVGTGTGAGFNQPSAVTLADAFTLQESTVYGIALVFTSLTQHDYTNGTGSNQVYFNSDLTITNGSASNSPLTGLFHPRVWNGTMYYNASESEGGIPEPSTISMMLLAGGLALLARRKAA